MEPLLLIAAGTVIELSAEALGTVLVAGCVFDPLLLLPQAASARARVAAVPTAAVRLTRLVRDATRSPSSGGMDDACLQRAGNTFRGYSLGVHSANGT